MVATPDIPRLVAVRQDFAGVLSGRTLLIFPEKNSLELVRAVVGRHLPLEDIVGTTEQPNLPGTIDEHPNWRRRLPPKNGLAGARAKTRLKEIAETRETR